jgi:Protein of unknown function (DUF4245)
MSRRAATLVVLAALLAGCTGGSSGSEDPGTLDVSSLEKAARRANFPVRLPAPLEEQKLLNVMWVTAVGGSVGELSFDLIAPGGGIVTVHQSGDAGAGLIRTMLTDTTPLAARQIGTESWQAYRAPLLAGLLLVQRDETGVETAVSGDVSLGTLAAVAASLR